MRSRRAKARPVLGVLVAALAAALAGPVRAQQDTTGLVPIPGYRGFVTDVAGVIGDSRRAQLEGFLDQLRSKTGAEFAVLTVESSAPQDPDQYKVRVFERWKLGKHGEDNGVLLLVSMREHALRFETGYGLEGVLPDGWQARMLRDLAVPRFRQGDPEGGITAAVLATAQRIAQDKGVTLTWDGRELRYDSIGARRETLPPWVVALILFLIVSAISSAMRRRGIVTRGGWGGPFIGGGFGGWGGGFGGGGGGGGSFGGFGGGSSGGGGGGANW